MKINFNKTLLAVAILFAMSSCDREEYDDVAAAGSWKYVGLTNVGGTFNEGNGAAPTTVNFRVFIGGVATNDTDVTVDFASSGDAVYNTDYTLSGVTGASNNGFSVVIPSGEMSAAFSLTTVTNVDEGADRAVSFELSGADNGFNVDSRTTIASNSVTIQDDDCAFDLATDFAGASQVTEVYSASEYGPYDPNVTFTNSTTLTINNFWDWGWVATLTVDPTDNSVVISTTDGGAGGLGGLVGCFDWEVSGSGVLSPCTGEILISPTVSSACYGYTATFDYNIAF